MKLKDVVVTLKQIRDYEFDVSKARDEAGVLEADQMSLFIFNQLISAFEADGELSFTETHREWIKNHLSRVWDMLAPSNADYFMNPFGRTTSMFTALAKYTTEDLFKATHPNASKKEKPEPWLGLMVPTLDYDVAMGHSTAVPPFDFYNYTIKKDLKKLIFNPAAFQGVAVKDNLQLTESTITRIESHDPNTLKLVGLKNKPTRVRAPHINQTIKQVRQERHPLTNTHSETDMQALQARIINRWVEAVATNAKQAIRYMSDYLPMYLWRDYLEALPKDKIHALIMNQDDLDLSDYSNQLPFSCLSLQDYRLRQSENEAEQIVASNILGGLVAGGSLVTQAESLNADDFLLTYLTDYLPVKAWPAFVDSLSQATVHRLVAKIKPTLNEANQRAFTYLSLQDYKFKQTTELSLVISHLLNGLVAGDSLGSLGAWLNADEVLLAYMTDYLPASKWPAYVDALSQKKVAELVGTIQLRDLTNKNILRAFTVLSLQDYKLKHDKASAAAINASVLLRGVVADGVSWVNQVEILNAYDILLAFMSDYVPAQSWPGFVDALSAEHVAQLVAKTDGFESAKEPTQRALAYLNLQHYITQRKNQGAHTSMLGALGSSLYMAIPDKDAKLTVANAILGKLAAGDSLASITEYLKSAALSAAEKLAVANGSLGILLKKCFLENAALVAKAEPEVSVAATPAAATGMFSGLMGIFSKPAATQQVLSEPAPRFTM